MALSKSALRRLPLASLLLSLTFGHADAADLVLTGPSGTVGAPGVTGQPGQNGGNAAPLVISFSPVNDPSVTLTLSGGAGGAGGIGAAESGATPPSNGGNGGHGGAANGQASSAPLSGNAYASSSVSGGAGGSGGAPGDSGVGPGCDIPWYEMCAASGGAGGHGGDASARGTAMVVGNGVATASAWAQGGQGSEGYGRGVDAGRGGAAVASAYGQSDTGEVKVSAGVQGGNGGGSYGGQAGHGASVVLDNAVGGQTQGALSLTQIAGGGSGGNALLAVSGGNGGNARSSLTLSDAAASVLTANIRSIGGGGGTHEHDYGNTTTVHRGGNAVTEVTLHSSRAGVTVTGNLEAYAGNSADAIGTGTLSGQATVYGNVLAYGGDGSSGGLYGTPTDGGAATGALSLSSSGGMVEATIVAHGGAGGSGAYGGQSGVGGSATSTLTLSGTGAKGSSLAISGNTGGNWTLPTASSTINAITTGALGVDVGSTAQGGSGSAAQATTTVTSGGGAGDAQAAVKGTAEAYGGSAFYTRGGNASASLSLAGSGTLDGSAIALGGHGIGDMNVGGGGDGGTANSVASGVTGGAHDVNLRAEAVGGNSYPWGNAGGANASVYGESGSGAVTLLARAVGGTSVSGGANVALNNAVSGKTSGALSLTQYAEGGLSAYSNGGNATSTLALLSATAASLSGQSEARGGNADASFGAQGGAGYATIALTSTRVGAAVTAGAKAVGGDGSGRAEARASAAGLGASTAHASAEGDVAVSSASASGVGRGGTGGPGGTGGILASAVGHGRLGAVSADSLATASNGVGKAHGRAETNLGQDVTRAYTVSSANYGGAAHALPALDGSVQAFAHVNGAPDAAAAAQLRASAPALAAALTGPLLGSGVHGGAYAPDGGGQVLTYVSTGEFEFELAAGSRLVLGVFRGSRAGAGFDLLDLSISGNGVSLFSRSFTSLAQADLFFASSVLDLGLFGAGVQDLVITTALTASSAGGYGFGYAFGSGVAAVPETAHWLMLVLGLAVLGGFSRRRCATRWR